MKKIWRHLALLTASVALGTSAIAQDKKEEPSGPPAGEPAVFTSTDTVRIGGKQIAYDVTAKETFFYDQKDAPNASIFSFS